MNIYIEKVPPLNHVVFVLFLITFLETPRLGVVHKALCCVLQAPQRCRCIVWLGNTAKCIITPLLFKCKKNKIKIQLLLVYYFIQRLKNNNNNITSSSTEVSFAVAKCRSKVETHLIGSEREVAFATSHPTTCAPSPRKLSPAPLPAVRKQHAWSADERAGRQWSRTPGEAAGVADGLLTRTCCLPERKLPDRGGTGWR